MDLIAQIRKDNGADQELWLSHDADPQVKKTITSMRRNLESSLNCLAAELYSKETHFVLELIQNADDNKYDDTPTMSINYTNDYILVQSNERGFSEGNVRAICKVGGSTKKYQKGYIGEKGIGFKSVFKVADEVYISSRNFTFKFDCKQDLGMITPAWASFPVPHQTGWTALYIRLNRPRDSELEAHLIELQPSLLLFLRKLRSLTIKTPNGTVCDFRRRDIQQGVIALDREERGENSTSESTSYLVVKQSIRTPSDEMKRLDISESEIVLAFPISDQGKPIISRQAVHAFLPLRSYGFHFIIQADFLTSSSREDILSDLSWNKSLRDGIQVIFFSAVDKFLDRPGLRYCWFRYLPSNITDDFFLPVQRFIKSDLAKRPFFFSADGGRRLPRDVIILTAEFMDDDNRPLVPENYLPQSKRYLSPSYDVVNDGRRLRNLGVVDMSRDDFLSGLKNMGALIPSQSENWHEAVCQALLWFPRTSYRHRIMQLRILPLQSGAWDFVSSGNHLFNSKVADVPRDIGLPLLVDIETRSQRYRLFAELGVKKADPPEIADIILKLHRSNSLRPSFHSLVDHARFLFAHRNDRGFPEARGLRVMDESRRVTSPEDIYMDHPGDGEIPLRDFLLPPARFIHSSYMTESNPRSRKDWFDWLRDNVGVCVAPRAINGKPSVELRNFVQTACTDTRRFLCILRERWTQLESKLNSKGISELSNITVVCEDGSKQKMNTAFLKRKNLKEASDISFLPVDEPDSQSWDFLAKLGVTLSVNGMFYLKNLLRLRERGSQDASGIADVYKQLEARFDEDDNASQIRNAFRRESLIFYRSASGQGGKWISNSDCVWDGPRSMRSKVSLKPVYRTLERLFRQQLEICQAPDVILLDEVRQLSASERGKELSPEIHQRVFSILRDISDLIHRAASDLSPPLLWLEQLSEEAIFTVDVPSKGVVLCALSDSFYVPDKSRRLSTHFQDKVPLLVPPKSYTSLSEIEPILESPFFMTGIQYLERSVECVLTEEGVRVPDSVTTDVYASYASKIERLLRATVSTKKYTPLLPKLRNISVFQVDSLASSFALGDVVAKTTETLIIKEEEEQFSILINKRCPPEKYRVIFCHKMAKLLELDPTKVLLYVVTDPLVLEEILAHEGTPDIAIDDEDPRDNSWAQDIRSGNASESDTTSVPLPAFQSSRRSVRLSRQFPGLYQGIALVHESTSRQLINPSDVVEMGTPDGSSLAAFEHILQQASASLNPSDVVETGVARATSPILSDAAVERSSASTPPPDVFSVSSTSATTLTSPSVSQMSIASRATNPSLSRGYGGGSRMTADETLNGILGELYVFRTLKNILPDFTEENWTSGLRGCVPQFSAYNGSSRADLVYKDTRGVLTRQLLGQAKCDLWAANWPTFYLEVKSTSGTNEQPFHMSTRQLETALELTMREQDPNYTSPPKSIYVIVRVSGIRTEPSLKFYVDPHRFVYNGDIVIASDGVEMVARSSGALRA